MIGSMNIADINISNTNDNDNHSTTPGRRYYTYYTNLICCLATAISTVIKYILV